MDIRKTLGLLGLGLLIGMLFLRVVGGVLLGWTNFVTVYWIGTIATVLVLASFRGWQQAFVWTHARLAHAGHAAVPHVRAAGAHAMANPFAWLSVLFLCLSALCLWMALWRESRELAILGAVSLELSIIAGVYWHNVHLSFRQWIFGLVSYNSLVFVFFTNATWGQLAVITLAVASSVVFLFHKEREVLGALWKAILWIFRKAVTFIVWIVLKVGAMLVNLLSGKHGTAAALLTAGIIAMIVFLFTMTSSAFGGSQIAVGGIRVSLAVVSFVAAFFLLVGAAISFGEKTFSK